MDIKPFGEMKYYEGHLLEKTFTNKELYQRILRLIKIKNENECHEDCIFLTTSICLLFGDVEKICSRYTRHNICKKRFKKGSK